MPTANLGTCEPILINGYIIHRQIDRYVLLVYFFEERWLTKSSYRLSNLPSVSELVSGDTTTVDTYLEMTRAVLNTCVDLAWLGRQD